MNQVTVGELITLLKAVKETTRPVVFDKGKYWPTYLDSWRGAYDELAIAYSDSERTLSCHTFLKILRAVIGATRQGYKGGIFRMGKNTPLWVANYGECSAWRRNERGVVGMKEKKHVVSILTKKMEY